MANAVRERIVAKSLADDVLTANYTAYAGLTAWEETYRRRSQAAAARFEALPERDKQAQRQSLARMRPAANKSRRSQKGANPGEAR